MVLSQLSDKAQTILVDALNIEGIGKGRFALVETLGRGVRTSLDSAQVYGDDEIALRMAIDQLLDTGIVVREQSGGFIVTPFAHALILSEP